MIGLGRIGVTVMLALSAAARAQCPPPGWDEAALRRLRDARFELTDDARRAALAQALLDCLADPRPALRDDIAFEALSTWLRAGRLPVAQLAALRDALLPRLTAADPDGVARPFAALVLAELARVDRRTPWLDAAGRTALLQAAVAYERGVRDYRGFDGVNGWRHGVAHGADWLMQLALNPALDRAALDAILGAVASQVAPPGEHFYVYGESERLARPAFQAARRGMHDEAWWTAWLGALAAPAPSSSWDDALRSQAGLARRHNAQAFVQVLYVMVQESGDPALMARMRPGLLAALKALP